MLRPSKFILIAAAVCVSLAAAARPEGIFNPAATFVGNLEGIDSNKASGAVNPVPTFIGEVAATNSGSSMTASAVPIGVAGTNRRVIVVASYDVNVAGQAIISATIGGVSATLHAAVDDTIASNSGVAIFSAIVPTGTTATITALLAGGGSVAGLFGVYTVDNSTLLSGTPTTGTSTFSSASQTTFTTSLTASNGGFVISVWDSNDAGTHTPITTPGATQDAVSNNTGIFSQTGLSAGTITPTLTISGAAVRWAMASASWR